MRKDLAYFYGICNQPDAELFKKQCAAFEKKFPNLEKEPLLEDVDGSAYQTYHHEHGVIRVCNDYALGDLYVESDFDLEPYFKEEP